MNLFVFAPRKFNYIYVHWLQFYALEVEVVTKSYLGQFDFISLFASVILEIFGAGQIEFWIICFF